MDNWDLYVFENDQEESKIKMIRKSIIAVVMTAIVIGLIHYQVNASTLATKFRSEFGEKDQLIRWQSEFRIVEDLDFHQHTIGVRKRLGESFDIGGYYRVVFKESDNEWSTENRPFIEGRFRTKADVATLFYRLRGEARFRESSSFRLRYEVKARLNEYISDVKYSFALELFHNLTDRTLDQLRLTISASPKEHIFSPYLQLKSSIQEGQLESPTYTGGVIIKIL